MAIKHNYLPKHQKGFILVLALTILSIMLIIGTAIMSYSNQSIITTRRSLKTTQCLSLAEAGIDHGIRQLNLDLNYTGTANPITLGTGEFETTIIGSGLNRELTSTAYVPTKANFQVKKQLRVDLNINNTNISFPYGVQSGEGGISMDNSAKIIGDIYSNGSIDGSSSNTITGSAKVANKNIVIPPIQWPETEYDDDYTFGRNNSIVDIAQSFTATQDSNVTKVAMWLKKVNTPSDITYYILGDNSGKPDKSSVFGSKTISASGITGTYSWAEAAITNSQPLISGQKYWLVIDAGTDNNNYWEIGVDTDNAYPSQTGLYSDNYNKNNADWDTTSKDFLFKVWLASSNNYINKVNVTGDAYVHTFTNGDIGRDFFGYTFQNGDISRHAHAKELLATCSVLGNAYADTDNCTVTGTKSGGTGEPDLPLSDYPITAANIQDFKDTATNTNNFSGNYTPTGGGAVELGPIRINGNLDLSGIDTLNIVGTIYVTGTITFKVGLNVQLDPSYGVSSGMMITDQPTVVSNNVTFRGSGQANSYILFISTSNSLDPANPAIYLKNNSDSAIVFAPYGLVNLNNNAEVKETTAYKIHISQSATVTYAAALQNVLFSNGPGGGWRMKPGTWREL